MRATLPRTYDSLADVAIGGLARSGTTFALRRSYREDLVLMAVDIKLMSRITSPRMSAPRTYTMRARAEATAATRLRVLRAVLELSEEKLTIEITLDEVASRAGTSVQTVLRHFGSRDGLLDEAVKLASSEVEQERQVTAGDVDGAVEAVVAHYEKRGDYVLRLLGQEHDPRIAAVVTPGKELHRRWVERSFGPQLQGRPRAEREALADLLVVATDLYTWKLLRRDRGLDRQTVQARMRSLITAILAGP
jgi:AcrR family transcriptional regulator